MRAIEWQRIFRVGPFRAGLLVTLLVLAVHPVSSMGPVCGPAREIIQALDDRFRDALFILRGPQVRESMPVVVVDIDEKSLSALGQWPWPRTVVADLIERIHACDPKAIGLDMVFAEPDRTSLSQRLPDLGALTGQSVEIPKIHDEDGWLRELPEIASDYRNVFQQALNLPSIPASSLHLNHDLRLAEVIGKSPRLVLGYVWLMDHEQVGSDSENVSPTGAGTFVAKALPGTQRSSQYEYQGVTPAKAVLNYELLDEAAGGRCGAFNVGFGHRGIVRRVALAWEYKNNHYPSLALQMLRIGAGDAQGCILFDDMGIDRIELPSRVIYTDRIGQLYVNYRGGKRSFPYISVCDILQGKVSSDSFKDKYVLLGTSAAGLMDLRSIPFEGAYPGVEVHANVIDNILQEDYLRTPKEASGLEWLGILAAGFAAACLLKFCRPLVGATCVLLLFVACIAGNYLLLFHYHLVFNCMYVLLAIVAVTCVVPTVNFFLEGRQKRFIRSAFGTYVSPELVDEMVAQPDKLALQGEEKELSVFFSDIRGFTSFAENLSAEKLGRFLNAYFTPMTDIVLAHQGTVDKFMGDAIMAFWGAPLPVPNHAEQAARSALAMAAALEPLQQTWQEQGVPDLAVGIGINTGRVSVGNMGSDSRFNYTVVGDAVNLASRLEGLNKIYGTQIILSEATRAQLGPEFHCRRLDRVRVKGKKQAVWLYELLAEGNVPDSLRHDVDIFESVLEAYQDRKFEIAFKTLRPLLDGQTQPLYLLYAERLAQLRQVPPGQDWDGIYTLDSK